MLRRDTERSCQQLTELVTGLSSQVINLTARMNSGGINEGVNNGGHRGNGNPTFSFARFSKVDFPKFACEDVLGWVYKCEQFFLVDNTQELAMVRIACIHC